LTGSSVPGVDGDAGALLTVSWFGGGALAQPDSPLYLSKNGGAGVPVPACLKVKGIYLNTPCYTARKINRRRVRSPTRWPCSRVTRLSDASRRCPVRSVATS